MMARRFIPQPQRLGFRELAWTCGYRGPAMAQGAAIGPVQSRTAT